MMGRLNHDQKTAFLRGFSTCHGCMFDLVHFPQSGMISLIVEMPEDPRHRSRHGWLGRGNRND